VSARKQLLSARGGFFAFSNHNSLLSDKLLKSGIDLSAENMLGIFVATTANNSHFVSILF